ncbi:MAG: SRPBCC family protein [Tatlockia sp.]|jgi:hypothetical protein
MRVLRFLSRALLILGTIFICGGLLIPSEWKVSRAITVHASPEQIYPLVSNFQEWEKWSPWNSTQDASLHYQYEGPAAGVGAKQRWESKKMGKGSMQMTFAEPQQGIAYDLFINMGQSQSRLHGEIAFHPQGEETRLTWTDQGNSGKHFGKRWMSLLIKTMLGKDMDKGLADLKNQVEKG